MNLDNVFNFIILTNLFYFVNGDTIAFPVDDFLADKKYNSDGRKPVWVPGKCAENEILYPIDKVDDWICDCKPAYIYHPDTGSCYLPYQQGPCDNGKYLILKQNKVVPECDDNPCPNGQIKYKNQCHQYGKSNACNHRLSEYLEIDAVSMRPKCIKSSKSPFFVTAIDGLSLPQTSAIVPNMSIRTRIDSGESVLQTVKLPYGAKETYENAPWCQKGTKRRIINTCVEN